MNAPSPQSGKIRWLVSPKYDLCFFIFSCVLTFVFYGIYRIAHHAGFVLNGDAILITYFIFTAFFDHPHIFQTFSRTHYDKEEFNKRRGTYTWGLAGFVAVGFFVMAMGWERELIVFAALYGSWHIIRQHYGILVAYKIINQDQEPVDNWLDQIVFYTGMFACFFNDYADIRGPVVIYQDLRATFPSMPADFGKILWHIVLVLLVVYGARQVWRIGQGKTINLPKLLLMSAALSTHYFIFFATATPFLIAEALETVYHNVQYQGWIMYYQKKRFPNIKHVALKRFGISLAYGITVGVVEIYGLMRMEWALWLFVPATMLVIFHYYVDGFVWKFSDYPDLRKLLFKPPSTNPTT